MNSTLEQRLLESKGTSNQSYGKLATSEDEMAKNRANLQTSLKGLGTESSIKNGSVVPIISSNAGKTTIDNAVKDQKTDITKITPTPTTTTTETKSTVAKKNPAMESVGALTAEEASATGVDVKNGYTYDTTTGYFIPKASTQENKDVNAKYDAEAKDVEDTFKPFEKNLDVTTQNLINSYKNTFTQRMQEERTTTANAVRSANTVNMRTGISRYAPSQAQQVLTSVEREGLDRIRKIGIEENQLIAEAEQNLAEKKYDVFLQKRSELKDIRKERVDQLNKIQEAGQKEFEYKRELLQKEVENLQKQKDEIILDARKNGATSDVINAISNATSFTDAVNVAGDYLQGGTGIIGEYNLYKRQAVDMGQTPMSFDEYQTRDANRKVSLAKASLSGLPTNIVNQIDKLSSAFDSSPITKQFNEVLNKKIAAESIINTDIKGPADLSLVFDFMKSLDPNSVVRETEYETAAKSGNIFQGAYSKFNGYLKEGGGFLPDNVRKEFLNIIDKKYQAVEKQYSNLESETARKINMKSGSDDGKDYLTNYRVNVGQEIIDEQVGDETKLTDFLTANPDRIDQASTLAETIDETTGKPFTAKQVLEFLNQAK